MTRRNPTSTYRLQVTADFDLDAARDVVDYVRDLGADWLYLSPSCRRSPAPATGTTSSTTATSTPNAAATTPSGHWPRPRTRPGSASSSTSCRTTSVWPRPR